MSSKKYEKPIIEVTEDFFEGVYAASGCYFVTATITQIPENGRGDYRIQVNGAHNASDSHHSSEQILTIVFNNPVIYKSSNGEDAGSNLNVVHIRFGYHSNGVEGVGLGDVIVEADPGLSIISTNLSCNKDCGIH